MRDTGVFVDMGWSPCAEIGGGSTISEPLSPRLFFGVSFFTELDMQPDAYRPTFEQVPNDSWEKRKRQVDRSPRCAMLGAC